MSSQSWVGRTIGERYQLETLLGAGGMSAVYRAYDPNLRRTVAVKLIHPHLSGNPNFVNRFKEEAAAVASLRHPNIVQVHDFNNQGDTYYMVMEYLAGETLQDYLRRLNKAGRHMPAPEALRICLQICEAASYAHQHELIHRDIKPANIMLDVNGQAILMDFGIVKIVGGQYHTATGATIGTAIYMSPEQIRGERVDERADIYSMGVMLFEMLNGQPPYEADSALTLMMMHLNDPIPDLCDLRPGLPSRLVAVVVKALAKERNQRYQTAAEMADDLRKSAEELSSNNLETVDGAANLAPDATPQRKAPPAQEPGPTEVGVYTHVPGPDAETQPPEMAEPLAEPGLNDAALALSETGPNEVLAETEPGLTGLATTEPSLTETGAPAPVSGQPADGQSVAGQLVANQAGSQAQEPGQLMPFQMPSVGTGTAKKPRKSRLQFRRLVPILGIILLVVLAASAVWLVNERRPPELLLKPIERPSIPISLETQPRLVSLGQWEVDANCRQLTFSPDSTTLASGCNREQVRFSPYRHYTSLWQVESGELQTHLTGHTAWMLGQDFSPDGATLATSAEDESVHFWQVADGELTFSIQSGEGPLAGLDYSPNGKLLAGAIWNGAGLWQVNNGNLLRIYPSDENNLFSITFSPDGETLAGGSDTGEIYVWNVSDGALLYTLPGHTARVNQVAFSPDGTHLVSASDDHFLKLWLMEDGSLISTLSGHSESVTNLAYSPDGSLIASSSWDGTLRLWQASDGQFLRLIETEASSFGVVFSPNGAWLVNATDDGRLLFWGVSEALSMSRLILPPD